MTKAIDIYVRVSRKGTRENFTSPEDQEREARTFADRHSIRVGKVLRDIDVSGGTLERPALNEALQRVRGGSSGGIVVAYLSRASRDTRQGLELLETITRAGGAVYAPNLPDYLTADGKMLTTIQLAVDTGYRERKREELERAKENAIANGIPVKRNPPVGYRRRSRTDRRLEIDATARAVRRAFEMRAAGEGPAAIGAFLTEQGVRTSQESKTWSKQAVYQLLRNRTYLGELSYGRDRRFVNPAAHEAIVDVATFQAAQGGNGRTLAAPRSHESQNLLTGIARCAGCRYCLQATKTSRGKRIYRCTRTRSGGVCPQPTRLPADAVEAAVVAAFWALTDDLEAEGKQDESGDVARLEEALRRAEKALQDWATPAVQEAIGDMGIYAAGLRERRDAADAAAEELGRARASSGRDRLPDVQTLRATWERMGAQDRRQLLALRFDCLALHRDGRVVAYPAGTGPDDLPRRGFTQAPVLRPFADAPDGARVLAL